MTPASLSALHHSAFQTPRPWTAAEFESLLGGAGVFVLGDVRGFVMGRTVADEAEVLTLAVAPDARRQGIGRSLMQAFAHHAAAAGARTAFLEVAANNTAAISLYLSLGYTQTGRRKNYFHAKNDTPLDALVMTRFLTICA